MSCYLLSINKVCVQTMKQIHEMASTPTRVDPRKVSTFPRLLHPHPHPPRFHQLLGEVEVHFVIHVLALRIEALQDLSQHVDSLLTAQTSTLGLELLQQVFGGHRFADQVPPHGFLC